jgi:hypothetical protein
MASRFLRPVVAAVLAGALVAAAGCGGGSDKPGYCTDRAALEQSVKSLTSLKPSEGLSGLQTSLQTIQAEVNRLVASARSDFPSETSAIRSSFTALSTDVRALPSSPSASQLAAVAADAASAVSAIRGFVNATKSECD